MQSSWASSGGRQLMVQFVPLWTLRVPVFRSLTLNQAGSSGPGTSSCHWQPVPPRADVGGRRNNQSLQCTAPDVFNAAAIQELNTSQAVPICSSACASIKLEPRSHPARAPLPATSGEAAVDCRRFSSHGGVASGRNELVSTVHCRRVRRDSGSRRGEPKRAILRSHLVGSCASESLAGAERDRPVGASASLRRLQ
jgi:hypothetical protein